MTTDELLGHILAVLITLLILAAVALGRYLGKK